jgi:hypothetical protein
MVTTRNGLLSTAETFLGDAVKAEIRNGNYAADKKQYNVQTGIPSIGQMADNYIGLMRAARARAGNFWADTTVKGDTDFCKALLTP